MKRYFIFGVLTILIITLNFAFIIVLLAEEARINYNVLLLMWAGVILAAFGLVYLLKKKPLRQGRKTVDSNKLPSKSTDAPSSNGDKLSIYPEKTIKKFKIFLPQDLTPKIQAGFFSGHIKTEEYAQEFVQAVYDGNGQLLGFISKKKKRLCHNLSQLYNEPIICWGEINWDNDKRTYKVKAYVPVLYNQGEMNRLRKLLRLQTDLLHLKSSAHPTNKFLYLEKAEEILYLQESEKPVPSLHCEPDKAVVEQLFRRILFNKEAIEVMRLKQFPHLLKQLSPALKEELSLAIHEAGNRMVS